jgi:hypothetical protein
VLGPSFAELPSVTTFGGQWLLVFHRKFSHDSTHAVIHAVLVDPDGTPNPDFVVGGEGFDPAVAASANEAFVVWSTRLTGGVQPDIDGRRILPGGTLSGGTIEVAAEEDYQTEPAIAWTGTEFVAVWEDLRNALFFFDERADLFGARIDPLGAVLDPAGFAVRTGDPPAVDPSVATQSGTTLVAGAFFRAGDSSSYRVGLRRLGTWDALGEGLAGTHGVPILDGTGALAPGSTVELQLSNALAGSICVFAIGPAQGNVPFFGGTLVPFPLRYTLFFGTGPIGETSLTATVTNPLLPGSSIFAQAWVLDPLAAQGLAGSNAVTETAP